MALILAACATGLLAPALEAADAGIARKMRDQLAQSCPAMVKQFGSGASMTERFGADAPDAQAICTCGIEALDKDPRVADLLSLRGDTPLLQQEMRRASAIIELRAMEHLFDCWAGKFEPAFEADRMPRAKNLQLDGVWEGTLEMSMIPEGSQGFDWQPGLIVRISMRGPTAEVKYKSGDAWREIKQFALTRHDTNSVITAIDSGADGDGTWIETWSFAVSPLTNDRLQVSFQRQVNNKNLPRDNAHAVFGAFAHGVFQRVTN